VFYININMKKLLFLLVILISIQSLAQTKPGFTRFYTKSQSIGQWNDSTGNAPLRDTVAATTGIGELRQRPQDNKLYHSISTTADKKWEEIGTGTGGGDSTFIKPFAHLTALRDDNFYTHAGNLIAKLQGYNTPGDGGGTDFYWDGSSSATDDGVFIIKPSAVSGSGRWLKIFKGRIRASEAGIKSDGTDQTATLISRLSLSSVKEIVIEDGAIKIDSTVNFHGKKLIVQNGSYITGSGTIDSTILECDFLQQAFDTTLTVTNLINSVRSVKWFGAIADYKEDGTSGTYTNNLTAFTKCYSAGVDLQFADSRYLLYKDLYVPAARRKGYGYYLGGQWLWNAEGTVFGDGASSTKLFFPNGLDSAAIYIAPPLTSSAGFGGTVLRKGGQNQVFHDISFYGAPITSDIGAGTYFNNKSHGIRVESNNVLGYNFEVDRFLGDGVHIYADVQQTPATNANNCTFRNFVANMNGGSGVSLRGGDANNIRLYDFNASKNGRWGTADYSFLGNKYDGGHVADNAYENQWQKVNVYNSGHRYRAIKSVVKAVSNNGFRYTCKVEHDRSTANSEPGVGSAWHTYWDSVGVGGASAVYNDYTDEGNWYYVVNAIVPGVTTGWANYWEEWGTLGSADLFDPQYDSTHWYTEGGGYLSHGQNQRCVFNACYSEGDQHEFTNRGLSIAVGAFTGGDGKIPSGIGYDNVTSSIQSVGWKAVNPTTLFSAFISGNYKSSGYPFLGFKNSDFNMGFSYIDGSWQSDWANAFSQGTIKFISPDYTGKADLGLDTIRSSYGVSPVIDKLHLLQVGGSGHRLLGLTSSTTAPTTGDYGVGSVLLYNGSDTTLLMFRCTTASVAGNGGTWLRINKGGSGVITGTAGRIALFDPTTGALTDNSLLAWTPTKTTLGTDTVKVSNLQINKAFDLPTTSYANSGGSGDRTATITTTTNLSVGGTAWTNMINGIKQPETGTYLNGSSCVGAYMTFDCGVGQSKVITEITWYQSAGAYSHGIWKGQASDDGVTYTDISSNQTLGGAAVTTFSLSPTKGYRYYRLAGVSGNTNGNPWIEEIEFKINDASAGIAYTKIQSTGVIRVQPDSSAVEVPTASYGDSSKNAANTGWVRHIADSIKNTISSMTNPMTTTGDIIYSSNNSGTPARLAAGTNGYMLSLQSGVPSWVNGANWGGGVTGGSISGSTGPFSVTSGSQYYINTGSSASTYNLPALSTNRFFFFKNAGSSTMNIARAGSDVIWTTSSVTSFTLMQVKAQWL
jgi:hypothetical protein